jgi:sulfate/thiosulfate transport system substrate-binding protein
MKVRRHIAAAALATAGALLLAACGSSSGDSGSSGSSPSVQLALVAYSTPQAAYTKIIKAFQATAAGKNITFTQSYGASGDQSRAVAAGLKADIVNFALEPDITRLVKANLVAADWNANQYKGMITKSVVVIGVRKGNPKNIQTWTDLTKPGVQVITANPFTSGGARWNVMAAYGAVSNKGTDKQAGVDYLHALFKNVPVQDDSARKALQTFTGGKGDAFLSYENEAIFAQQNGQAIDYVVPASTILIENPAAVTSTSKHPKEAKEFLDFLTTPTAQQIFADSGYRPVVPGIADGKFPTPANLFTITDLGGWTAVTKDFFDTKTGIMADVESSVGVTVAAK